MTHSITLSGVDLDYYIYSVRAQTLRTAVFNMAVGGKMYSKGNDLAVVRALSGVNFTLTEGDRLGIVGHNGSGKTTLLKVIAGIYEPTRGQVDVNGKMTSMIAPMLGLDLEATGLENIRNLGLMRFLSKKQIADRVDAIVEFSGLGDFIRLPVRTYSQGMIARLTFAVATEFDADILLLDEWLGAGDATFVHQASERMQRMADRAKILVLATHSYDLVETTCNKVCEMHAGKVAYFGSTDGWRRHRDAQAA